MTTRGLTAGSVRWLLVAALVAATAAGGVAEAAPSARASRYAAVVLDAETGEVLYERNADLPRYPASLTKIMTLYLAFEALAEGSLTLEQKIPVSAFAAGRDPSRLNVAPGTRLTVEEAILAMTTKSANDAACALGEALGDGSESRFGVTMTARARALGMKATTFRNASGLPQDGHVSSARDLALLSRALVRDYPEYYHYFSASSFEFHGTRYPNQNRFLRSYYGADGIKTGFINASRHNLSASALRGGKRLVAVVLGGDTQAWTREHATRLLDVSYAKIDPSLVMVATNADGEPRPRPRSEFAAAAVRAKRQAEAGSTTAEAAIPEPDATAALRDYADRIGSRRAAAAVAAASISERSGSGAAIRSVEVREPDAAQRRPARRKQQQLASVAVPERPGRAEGGAARAAASVDRPARASAATRPAAESAPTRSASRSSTIREPEPRPAPVRPRPRPATRPARSTAGGVARPAADEPTMAARHGGEWSVQVGLFRDATVARRRGEEARSQMPLELRGADLVVGRAGDGVHVVSRISRLSEQSARAACTQLQRGRVPCVVVPPGRPLIVATN